MELFFEKIGHRELIPIFEAEEFDYSSLILVTDRELIELNIPPHLRSSLLDKIRELPKTPFPKSTSTPVNKNQSGVAQKSSPSPNLPSKEIVTKSPDSSKSSSNTYSYSQLISRPAGVDHAKLETYLSDDEFQKVFKMGKQEFSKLPLWKKNNKKKELNLF